MKFIKVKALAVLIFGSSILMFSNVANAGCKINIKVVNKENALVFFSANTSKVKTKNGTWKNLNVGFIPSMNPQQTHTVIYNATFVCNKNRRYQFRFSKGSGQQWVQYYPSPTAFTKKTTVFVNARQP